MTQIFLPSKLLGDILRFPLNDQEKFCIYLRGKQTIDQRQRIHYCLFNSRRDSFTVPFSVKLESSVKHSAFDLMFSLAFAAILPKYVAKLI